MMEVKDLRLSQSDPQLVYLAVAAVVLVVD